MKGTKIRWASNSWNPMVGCTKVSAGCDRCYAETIAEKFRGSAFPNGFEPTFKPAKLDEPRKWDPSRIFVNSMSDVHHPSFTSDQIDEVYDRMAAWDQHDYLLLTKRPQRMWSYIRGWLERRGLDEVPPQIWLGTTIELDEFVWRADYLRRIPALVRFLSCEPLLGPLPSLDLTGIGWVITGGESGQGYRGMDHAWPRDLRDRCAEQRIAFYHKQDAAYRTETNPYLDGRRHEEYPLAHPALGRPRIMGVHHDAAEPDQLPMV